MKSYKSKKSTKELYLANCIMALVCSILFLTNVSLADNRSDQMNPNNDAYWESRGYDGRPDNWNDSNSHGYSDDYYERNNRSNQMNPNNGTYWKSRGYDGRPDNWNDSNSHEYSDDYYERNNRSNHWKSRDYYRIPDNKGNSNGHKKRSYKHPVTGGGIYQYIDKNGVRHFTNVPSKKYRPFIRKK